MRWQELGLVPRSVSARSVDVPTSTHDLKGFEDVARDLPPRTGARAVEGGAWSGVEDSQHRSLRDRGRGSDKA
jgi:hypothetical protein